VTTPAPQPPAPDPAGPLTAAEDRQWASFAHFGGAAIALFLLLSFVTGPVAQSFFAVLALVPALLILLVFGRRGPRTLVESKEALNFQISLIVVLVVWIVLSSLVVWAVITNFLFGFNLDAYYVLRFVLGIPSVALAVVGILFSVIGGLRVQKGGAYRYPVTVRLIK
jgi:uncharacterized Tic20 family protein